MSFEQIIRHQNEQEDRNQRESMLMKNREIASLSRRNQQLAEEYNGVVDKYNKLLKTANELREMTRELSSLGKQLQVKLDAETEKNKLLKEQNELLRHQVLQKNIDQVVLITHVREQKCGFCGGNTFYGNTCVECNDL